jgi:protein SCO1
MLPRRLICLAVAAFAIAATWFQLAYDKTPPLKVFKQVPDFELTERSGKTIRLDDLKGRVWIADFFYASCPGPCPIVSSKLSKLQDEMLKMDGALLVSISTQPETDTVEVLRKYAERFHASPDKWLFLTGDKSRIYSLANAGFLLTAVEQKDSKNPVIHSTKLALVDKAGNIRNFYDGDSDESAPRILHDIKFLLREQPSPK